MIVTTYRYSFHFYCIIRRPQMNETTVRLVRLKLHYFDFFCVFVQRAIVHRTVQEIHHKPKQVEFGPDECYNVDVVSTAANEWNNRSSSKAHTPLYFDLLWICSTACCTTNPQQIEASGVWA